MTSDPRILFQTPHFRVIAPDAKRDKNGFLTINGRIIVERATTDSLGVIVWVTHQELADPKSQRGYGVWYSLLASLADARDRDWGSDVAPSTTRDC